MVSWIQGRYSNRDDEKSGKILLQTMPYGRRRRRRGGRDQLVEGNKTLQERQQMADVSSPAEGSRSSERCPTHGMSRSPSFQSARATSSTASGWRVLRSEKKLKRLTTRETDVTHYIIKGLKFQPTLKSLRLTSSIPLTNIVVIDDQGNPKRCPSVTGLLETFFESVSGAYEMKKRAEITQLEAMVAALKNNKILSSHSSSTRL